MSIKLTRPQVNAALHTLWQAALASGGIGVAVDSAEKVNVSGVEQGLYVAGVAVLGSLFSVVKSLVLNSKAARSAAKATAAAQAELDRHQQLVGTIEPIFLDLLNKYGPKFSPSVHSDDGGVVKTDTNGVVQPAATV